MVFLGRRLAVALPDTVLEEKDSLRDKTAKLGVIARACAIYGVDVIEIFEDQKAEGDGAFIRKVLVYLETPQYLRRRLFPIDESLKFAGLLPPLRIPSHKARVPIERLGVGEVREGVVNADGTVDVGLDAAPKLNEREPPGSRITVAITSLNPLAATAVPREKVRGYWGYTVHAKSLEEVLSDPSFGLKIGTSRLGTPLHQAVGKMESSLRIAESVKLIFGSPSRGLLDIAGQKLSRQVDFLVNLFPEQQVVTVRTEEAIFAGLGLVSLLSLRGCRVNPP